MNVKRYLNKTRALWQVCEDRIYARWISIADFLTDRNFKVATTARKDGQLGVAYGLETKWTSPLSLLGVLRPSVSTVHSCTRTKCNSRSSAKWTMSARIPSLQVSRATTLETRGIILTHLQCIYLLVKLPMIVMPRLSCQTNEWPYF
jgi:hypothetical protein